MSDYLVQGGGTVYLLRPMNPEAEANRRMKTYATKFHKDGTVTYWCVFRQQWARVHSTAVTDAALATLPESDRKRICKDRAEVWDWLHKLEDEAFLRGGEKHGLRRSERR